VAAVVRALLLALHLALPTAAVLADRLAHAVEEPASDAGMLRRASAQARPAECALCQFIRTPSAAADPERPPRATAEHEVASSLPIQPPALAFEPGSPPARAPPAC
jgi:hypothetical protein